jgi:integrase
MVAVLWRAGLRISEALALNETDIDERRGSLLIRHGKGGLVGSARGAWTARHVLARLAWFPPAATSNRACDFPAHGSPTFFTAGIQRPRRHGRLARGATMVPSRLISPNRSGDWWITAHQPYRPVRL